MTVGDVMVHRGLTIPMRDGCKLRADVYTSASGEARPVLLHRTPYGRANPLATRASIEPLLAVEEGFAVVRQDVRGRFESDGAFDPFFQETLDGVDTLRWIGEQPWSDGRVSMYGRSYAGATQFLAAQVGPAELFAIAPDRATSEYWEGWTYQGGVLQLGFVLTWVLGSLASSELDRVGGIDPQRAADLRSRFDPLANDPAGVFSRPRDELLDALDDLAPYLRRWLEHPARTDFWLRASATERLPHVLVPALHITGWYDIFLAGSLMTYDRLRRSAGTAEAREGQRLIIGPWTHQTSGQASGGVVFGRQASMDVLDANRLHLEFFKACSAKVSPPGPRVLLYVMGANRWRAEDDWPIERAQSQRWHLRENGTLDVEPPIVAAGHSTILHDPTDPVPSLGGGTLQPGDEISLIAGPHDRQLIQSHPGVIYWTSGPLPGRYEVTGQLTAVLWVDADADDADYYVALSHVGADGRAFHVTDGILRCSFRDDPLGRASPLGRGSAVRIEIPMGATSIEFARDTRIRLEIAGSCFPRFEQHPDHRAPVRLRTFHNRVHPSHVVLPVIP